MGTVLLGGGANVTNSDTEHPARVQLVQSQPSANTWIATGAVDVGLGTSNSMTVTAYAICTA
jgi:hypothetical protein